MRSPGSLRVRARVAALVTSALMTSALTLAGAGSGTALAAVEGRPIPAVPFAPGTDVSRVVSVNGVGQAIVNRTGSPGYFLWNHGILTPLRYGDQPITPVDLNIAGQVIGTVRDGDGPPQGVRWERGTATPLPNAATFSVPLDLNNRGQATYLTVSINGGVPVVRAWLSDASGRTAQDLGVAPSLVYPSLAVNDAGQVAGNKTDSGGPVYGTTTGFLWTKGKLVDLGTLGGRTTLVTDLNERGQVVGRSDPAINAPSHAFLWTNGKMTDLGTLGGTLSQASAINDHGLVIGTSLTAAGTTDGFAWAGGHISALAVDGATAQPIGVNERDQVILTTGAATQPGQPARTLGWLWHAGQHTALGTLGGQSATPTDIDNVGAVFGASDLASGDTHAALWLPRL